MSDNWQSDVNQFEEECKGARLPDRPTIPGAPERRSLRKLIREEAYETLEAIDRITFLPHEDPRVIADVADEIADLIWVGLVAASHYGIRLQPVWDEVARTNMNKKDGPVDKDGKLGKPPGWTPPDIESIIRRQMGLTEKVKEEE